MMTVEIYDRNMTVAQSAQTVSYRAACEFARGAVFALIYNSRGTPVAVTAFSGDEQQKEEET
jgi:hypothetical protein